jgi:hypothetical protein
MSGRASTSDCLLTTATEAESDDSLPSRTPFSFSIEPGKFSGFLAVSPPRLLLGDLDEGLDLFDCFPPVGLSSGTSCDEDAVALPGKPVRKGNDFSCKEKRWLIR